MQLSELFFSLLIDTTGMDKGLAEAQRKMDAGAKALASSLLSPIKAALGQIAAGLSLAAITKQYLSQADAIGKMAESIGADVEELQAWSEAANQAGGSTEAFQSTVQGLSRNLQQAATNAKGPAAQALQQLGLRATDATGKARDTFEVLRDLAGKMEGMDKQKAMALGQKLGLDRGTIMLLQSGRAAVEDLVREQKEFGLYTKEDTEIAGKANKEIARLGLALKTGAAIILRHIVPAITWVTEKLTKVVQFFKRHQPLVVTGLAAIATVITARLIPSLIKMGIANAKAFAPFMVLAAIISAVALVVDDFWTYLHGGETALEGLWKKLGSGPELLEKLKAAWETTKTVASQFFEALAPYLENIIKLVGAFVAAWAFGKVISGISNTVSSIMGIGKAIRGVFAIIQANPLGVMITLLALIFIYWDDIIAIAQKFFDNLAEWTKSAGKWLSGVWDDFLSKTREIWENVKTTAEQKWNEVKASAEAMWEGIKQTANNIWENIKTTVTTKMTALWESLKSIFAWETWETAFANIFKINFEEIGQKISKLFSWDEWKKAFADIFDWTPDFSKIITAIENAFQEAWNWVLEHIPFVKWFIEKGGMAAEAVKDTVQGVSKAADKAMEDAGVQDMDELADASVRSYSPTPSDGVSSQAAASSTTNNETNYDVKQDDNRTFNFTFNGVTDDPNGFFNYAKGSLSKKPSWMSQSATTMTFGGNS